MPNASSASAGSVSRDARDARKTREARESWAGAVVARARIDNKAARKHTASRGVSKQGVRGPGADAGAGQRDSQGPRLSTLSDARRTASAMAGLAAIEATVARASLLFAVTAGADSEYLRNRMALATTGAADALRFAAAVEKAAFAATEKTAATAADAARAASSKNSEIAEARKALSETSDGERLKRLVIEIARLDREMSEELALYRVSASFPIFTVVDDFGLYAAEAKLKATTPEASDGPSRTAHQKGGASEAPAVIPPFHFHTDGDQLQWPVQAAS